MAYGMELVIGWQHKDWKAPLEALGLEVEYQDGVGQVLPQQEPTGDPWAGYDPPHIIEVKASARATEVDSLLRQAHLTAVREIGWRVVEPGGEGWESLSVVTPLGPRDLQPFALSVYYDSDNGGPETALLCVPLSKRYRPCFLDWKLSCGTLEPVVLDEDLRRMMDLARRHIVAVLPAFESASFMVSLEHY